VSLIAGIARGLELRPLNAIAVVRVIELGSRLSGNAARLTLQLRLVQDLLREPDHYAAKARAGKIGAAHVEEAVRMHIRCRDRDRERSYEQINRGTIMEDMKGAVTGQVNGLSVLQIGDFAFGQPSRITARARMGWGESIDIERQVEIGGALHSKGVRIIWGKIRTRAATGLIRQSGFRAILWRCRRRRRILR